MPIARCLTMSSGLRSVSKIGSKKEEFLKLLGLTDLGNKYVDGLKVAERLGVVIEPVNLPIKSVRAAPKYLRGEANII